jgi:hypothetical protein
MHTILPGLLLPANSTAWLGLQMVPPPTREKSSPWPIYTLEELTTRVWFEFSRICVGSWFNFARNRRRITIDSLLLLWVLHVWWARSIDTVSNEDGDLAPDDYTRRRK